MPFFCVVREERGAMQKKEKGKEKEGKKNGNVREIEEEKQEGKMGTDRQVFSESHIFPFRKDHKNGQS
jgi:hypothetical protein